MSNEAAEQQTDHQLVIGTIIGVWQVWQDFIYSGKGFCFLSPELSSYISYVT